MSLRRSNTVKTIFLLTILFMITSTFIQSAPAAPFSMAITDEDKSVIEEKALNWVSEFAPWVEEYDSYTLDWREADDLWPQSLSITYYYENEDLDDYSSRFWIDIDNWSLLQYSVGYLDGLEVIPFPFKVSREAAKKLAETFIPKAIPSLQGVKLIEIPDPYGTRNSLLGPPKYRFEFTQADQTNSPFPLYEVVINGNGKVIWFNSPGSMETNLSLQELISLDYSNINVPAAVLKHKEKTALTALYKSHIIKEWDAPINPDQPLTLGEMFKFVKLAISPYSDEIEYEKGTNAIFSDVNMSSDYYPYVFYFFRQNWITSDKKKKLNASSSLTRDTLAYYLVKVAGLEKASIKYRKDSALLKLKDYKKIAHPSAVGLMLNTGWMSANNGQFRPEGKVTIAEMAVILDKMSQFKTDFGKAIKK